MSGAATLKKTDNLQSSRMYLDIVKGVAIFLMLWGHCVQYCADNSFDFFENAVFKTIYSFHMPLFMLVSGYLFYFSCKKRNLRDLLAHRTQSMIQPIIMCSIFNYFITTVIIEHKLKSVINGQWFSSLDIYHLDSLWFLWSVLCSSIVVAIAEKATKNLFIKIVVLVLGAGFVWLFPNNDLNLYMYPYFVAGFLFSKYKDKIPMIIMKVKYAFLLLFPLMMLFYQKKHFIYTTGIKSSANKIEMISIDLYRWAIGFVGSVFALVIIELIYNLLICKKPVLGKPAVQLGKKSLQVYCLSIALLSFWLPKAYSKFCNMAGSNIFASNMILYNFVFTFLLAVLYAIVIYLFALLLEKIKIGKLLFGR